MDFNFYDMLATSLDELTGTVTAQLGDAISQEKITDNAEVWQQVGFASRPSNVKESPKDAAQAISIERPDGDVVIATRDIRGQQIYGNLNEGDTCLYASGSDGAGQPRVYLDGNTGGINLFTRSNNEESGTGMGVFVDPENDIIRITNAAGHGIVIDSDGVKIFTSGSVVDLGASNISLGSSGKTIIDGGTVGIGGSATNTTVDGIQIKLGGTTALPGVDYASLTAWVAQVNAALATAQGVVPAIVTPTSLPLPTTKVNVV